MASPNGTTNMVDPEIASSHNKQTPSTDTSESKRTVLPTQASNADMDIHQQKRIHATDTQDWYPYALAAVVVVGFFVLTVLLILRETSINEGHKDIVFMLFGGLVTGFSMVLSYFFGSSAGSAQKTVELAKIANSPR